MKKGTLIIILILLVIPITSAEISCSDDSEVDKDTKEVKLNSAKSINGLKIGLTKSGETIALNRMNADILIDSTKITLSKNSSIEAELETDTYTVSLVNSTDKSARIKIESSTENIEVGEIETIDVLKTFLIHSEEDGEVEFLIGLKQLSLSTDENPREIVTIAEKDYLTEIYYASDDEASFIVYKCITGEIQITSEVTEETEVNESIDNITETNVTEEPPEPQINTTELTNQTQVEQEEKDISIFNRFWHWLKGIFT